MNLDFQKKENNYACVTIHIDEPDYTPRIEEELNKFRKQMTMPGFRKGMVPMGMVNKLYRSHFLAQEVEKMLQEKLSSFLEENKAQLMGKPLPMANEKGDNVSDKSYKFRFEVGLLPALTLDINSFPEITHYKISPSEKEIQDIIKNIQTQHAKHEKTELSAPNTLIHFSAVQENGKIQFNNTYYFHKFPEKFKEVFMNKKSGDLISVNLLEFYNNQEAQIEKVINAHFHTLENNFIFTITITGIDTIIYPESNPEFYQKVFPNTQISSMDEFIQKVKEQIAGEYQKETDSVLFDDTIDGLKQRFSITLNEEYWKRLHQLQENSAMDESKKNKQHYHPVEFEKFREIVTEHCITLNITKQFQIKVEKEELMNYTKNYLNAMIPQQSLNENPKMLEYIQQTADKMLADEKHYLTTFSEIERKKMLDLFKTNPKLKNKETTLEEFFKK